MVSFLTTLYWPIVLKKKYMPKLNKSCIKRFVCRHVCSQKLSSRAPGKFDMKATLNAEMAQAGTCCRRDDDKNLK